MIHIRHRQAENKQRANMTESSPSAQHDGALSQRYLAVNLLHNDDGRKTEVDGSVIEESSVSIFVNAQEIATLMCSPFEPETLALGYLFNEHVIAGMDDVRLIQTNAPGTTVDVFLRQPYLELPRRMILTSGCGRNATFPILVEALPPLPIVPLATPEQLADRMQDLQQAARLYKAAGGVHTAILCTPDEPLFSAEDVSRHNTLDRLAGQALQHSHNTQDAILITSGRISSEMIVKARRMGIPVVASRSSPTSLAVQYAQHWQITVVGYMRRHQMRVYTCPQRLGLPAL